MKNTLLAITVLMGGTAISQELPMPSPTATLEQRIGLTDFTVKYSRPSVKDREIFGELVPYDQMWRTGANANTILEFNNDIDFAGKKVSAGKYALLTIPGEDQWTIILNEKTNMWGTAGYDEGKDAVRVEIEPVQGDMTETFTIEFDDVNGETANLVLDWAETEVKIPLRVEVAALAQKNIDEALASAGEDNKWEVYRNAASYYYNNKIESDKALDYINKSIGAKGDSWYSYWLKAEILAEKKNYKEAITTAQKAKEVGMKNANTNGGEFSYGDMIDSGIENWKTMAKS